MDRSWNWNTANDLARRSHLAGDPLTICPGTVKIFDQQLFHFALEIDSFGGETALQAVVKLAFLAV